MTLRFSPLRLSVFLFCFLFIAGISCKKETSQDGTESEQEINASKVAGEADSQSEIVFNEIFDDAMGPSDEVGMFGTGVFGRVNACPTVTLVHLTNTQFPIRVTLDFGTGCTGNDGRLRKGKIITEYTARLIVPGAIATTTFDGFYIDSIHVEGTHKITNTTNPIVSTPAQARQFKIDVTGAKLSVPSGNYVEWESHKTITQIEGQSTLDPRDDIFRVEGSANGKVKKANLLVAWQSTIIEPLIKKFNCHWIVKGKVRTVRPTLATNSPWIAVLDFGGGTCDNQAVVTINGVSHQITLP